MLCMKFASSSNFACPDVYIGEISQPLQHNPVKHCRCSYNGNDSAVFKHIIASGHIIYFNDATILIRGKTGLIVV